MTTRGTDPAAGLTPPPGCPAHALGAGAPRRIYGPEAERDPRALYEELRRRHGPVAPVLLHGDLPAWIVLGHRENLEVMRSPSRFSNDSRLWRMFQEGRVPADSPLRPMVEWQPMCVFADGAEHERLRSAVRDSVEQFDRRGVRRYVIRYTDQLVDAFAAEGRADLIEDFAEKLPMLVMTQLLGMPEEYGPQLVEATLDLLKGTETAVASNEFVVRTLRTLMERKKAEPGHDFASRLLGHEADLTDDEVLEHLRLVLISANETTVNLIANTLRLVLTDRRFRANLAGGHMTLPDALEQVLWDDPPLSAITGRWATGDTVLGGRQIKAGDMLLLGLAAGNVDPEIRPDLDRPLLGNRAHLAFSSGPHECPGQDIGRAIADTGVDTLLSRLPDLRLAVPESELRWSAAWLSKRLAALPVRFTPPASAVAPSGPAAPKDFASTAPGPLPAQVPGPRSDAQAAPRSSASARRSWRSAFFRSAD
ncbi:MULTISPECIES: cytochrome P450 [Streptomyces]|uniref:Cytochrome n=2 Tax=Streptomyces TaxID=1883 RepID=A0A100Y594_9ACTN|nr:MULTISPECIES: cytochrome P450 [Streptomyces]KUH37945.1 cytochrome [Streptomyces kanasensis]UUS29732.1 cytochrome P450 [Streptomyces changanensis]